LAAAKWNERKAALTQLKDLASYPRLVGGHTWARRGAAPRASRAFKMKGDGCAAACS
jgi:hypothetical protein